MPLVMLLTVVYQISPVGDGLGGEALVRGGCELDFDVAAAVAHWRVVSDTSRQFKAFLLDPHSLETL